MFIPDLHLENKKTQYKFYLPSDLFEDTILFEIKAKYEKYLFIIDDRDFKTKIIYNEDNINVSILDFFDEDKNKYIKYNNENLTKFYTEDKKAICYVSDKKMNWYLIKIDNDDKNGIINCFTEKIQNENEVEDDNINNILHDENFKKKIEDINIDFIEDIQYDIEEID